MSEVVVVSSDDNDADTSAENNVAVEGAVNAAVAANEAEHAAEDAKEAAETAIAAAEIAGMGAAMAGESAESANESATESAITLTQVWEALNTLPERLTAAMNPVSEESESEPEYDSTVVEEEPPQKQGWLSKIIGGY